MGDPIEVLPKWAIDRAKAIQKIEETNIAIGITQISYEEAGRVVLQKVSRTNDINYGKHTSSSADGTTDGAQAPTEV